MITGIILAVLAVFLLLVVAIMSFALPLGFWAGAERASTNYDDWVDDSNPDDSITISGRIDEEQKIMGFNAYKLKGCDYGFTSSDDIGDEGDFVIVEIEKDSFNSPQAKSARGTPVTIGPNVCCCCFTGIIFLVGIVLVVVGIAKGKKNEDGKNRKVNENEE